MGRKKSASKSCRRSRRSFESTGSRAAARTPRDGNDHESREKRIDSADTEEEPIDVYSRLTYPLVRQTLPKHLDGSEDEKEEEEEEESFELTVKPRFVFVSSLCAICSSESKVWCERCRMVSYCSPAHRDRGSRQHRDLCEPLADARASIEAIGSDDSNDRLDAERYRMLRLRLLASLESRSGRPLQLWEREIVLYPRVCRVCRAFGDRLTRCVACGMESFCPSHRDEHEKWCAEFRVLRTCLSLQQRHGCVQPKIPRRRPPSFVLDEENRSRERISDMGFDELTRRVYADCSYYRRMDGYTYAMLSHVCTIPLTVLYAMEICRAEWREQTELTVHVLGAEFQFEGINLHVWERMFLHLLPRLKKLRVTLVGPELRLPIGVPTRSLSRVKLCSECKAADRTVDVRFRPNALYHETSPPLPPLTPPPFDRLAEKPDVVCAFNPGLYRKTGFAGQDTWPETIRTFSKLQTPVIVTSYTEQEIFWEVDRIKSIDPDVRVVLEPRRNPFASVKPDRNFLSDHANPLIYKNYYVVVVEGGSISS